MENGEYDFDGTPDKQVRFLFLKYFLIPLFHLIMIIIIIITEHHCDAIVVRTTSESLTVTLNMSFVGAKTVNEKFGLQPLPKQCK